jgi:hypothetical protein
MRTTVSATQAGLEAAGHLVGRGHRDSGADPRADPHRRREAHLVEAVVDAHPHALGHVHVLDQGGQQRQRQIAVGDGGAERTVGGTGRVHMDPLVVAGGLGEQVDPLLVDLDPVAGPDLGADGGGQLGRGGEGLHVGPCA